MKKVVFFGLLAACAAIHAKVPSKQLRSNVDFFAHQFGKGKDAAVITDIIAYNKRASSYIFVLEVNKTSATRRAQHAGMVLQYTDYPHIARIIKSATPQGAFMVYDASKTPDRCAKKRSYVRRVKGDAGKKYVIGQGYCN